MMRTLIALACCLLLSQLWQPTALAQGGNIEAARAAEAAARDAFREKKFVVAAEGFGAAFRLDPRANTKYNEALAWSKAGQSAPAADAFEAALLFGGLDAKLEKAGTDSLAALKVKLGRLVVNVPLGASITVAHVAARGVPVKIHLAPGQHEVIAKLGDGSEQTKTVTIIAGADVALSFESVVAPPSPEPGPKKQEPLTPNAGDNSGLLIAGWVCVGVGAASLIAMGVTGALTLSKVSKYDDTGNTDVALHDEAVTLKTATNVLVAAGGGFAAIGVVLILIGTGSGDDGAATAISPTPNGFRVRF